VLREQLKPEQIDFLVNEGTEVLLESHPHITNLHVIKRSRFTHGLKKRISEEIRIFRLLKKGGYDLVIGLNPSSRVERCARFSSAPLRIGIAGKKGGRGYTHKASLAPSGRHYVDRHLDVLKRVGLFDQSSNRLPKINLFESAKTRIHRLLLRNGVGVSEKYFVVHPTSRWMFKCLAPKDMALIINELCEKKGMSVVLSSGPDDVEKSYIAKVKSFMTHEAIDFSGILSLTDLAELIRSSDFLMTVDTASLHIAEAVATPVVVFFGPTNEIDWGPRSNTSLVIKASNYACRPCNRDGCGGSKVSNCLLGFNIKEVALQVVKFIR
jgi:heptosyltransferase-3